MKIVYFDILQNLISQADDDVVMNYQPLFILRKIVAICFLIKIYINFSAIFFVILFQPTLLCSKTLYFGCIYTTAFIITTIFLEEFIIFKSFQ